MDKFKKMTHADNVAKQIVTSFQELSKSLREGDKITERFRCRKVILDLHPIPYKPADVLATRQLLRASQSIFAQFLGVSRSTVSAWEQGKCQPSEMACRFMDEIQRNPEYWRKRLSDSISVTA